MADITELSGIVTGWLDGMDAVLLTATEKPIVNYSQCEHPFEALADYLPTGKHLP